MEKYQILFHNLTKILINLNNKKVFKESKVKNQLGLLNLNKLDILARISDAVQREMTIENHPSRLIPLMKIQTPILHLSLQSGLTSSNLPLKLMKCLMNQKGQIKTLLKCPYFLKMPYLLRIPPEEILYPREFQNHLLFKLNNLFSKLLATNILRQVNLRICPDWVDSEGHIEKKGKSKSQKKQLKMKIILNCNQNQWSCWRRLRNRRKNKKQKSKRSNSIS